MGLRRRLRNLEREAEDLPPPPCPTCGSVIRYVEEYAGGFMLFKGFEPCPTCDPIPGSPKEEDAAEREPPRFDSRRWIKRIHVSCTEPREAPAVEDLDPGDVLRGPDGTLYRGEDSSGAQRDR